MVQGAGGGAGRQRPAAFLSARDLTSPTPSSLMTLSPCPFHTQHHPPSRIFQIPGGKPISLISIFSGISAPPSGTSSSELKPLDFIHSFMPHVFYSAQVGQALCLALRIQR